jgi:hyperosmotically inducible protein
MTLATLIAVAMIAGLAHEARADVTVTASSTDRTIGNEVENVLDNVLYHRPFDWVQAEVDQGKVVLTGSVYFNNLSQSMTRQIEKIDGVVSVENQVGILPVSIHDDQLRRDAYLSIYRDEMFNHFPSLAQLPVHIIVENGKITLFGMVNSEVESRKAESLVRDGALSFSVDNKLRIERDLP